MRVTVVGTGYVGTVTATCLAWLGAEVTGLDVDATRIGQLAAGQLPFHEPGLDDLLRETLATGRLSFDTAQETVADSDVVFLCVGTPPAPGGGPDLSQVCAAVTALAPHLPANCVLVNKSTVPVGSGNWVRTLVEETAPRSRHDFAVVSNPEFLREGHAVDDFLYPDRLVLGGEREGVASVLMLLQPILDQSFPAGRRSRLPTLFVTDLTSAEMIKYAANAFLATKISFANQVATLCELVGADARDVLPAIGADHRIGASFLGAGIGWGGSCFGKDIDALIETGRDYGYAATLLTATVEVNEAQRRRILQKLQRELKILKGKRIGVLGLAFKPHTDDVRDSPALELVRRLVAAGAVVSVYDPVVKQLPDGGPHVRETTDPYDAAHRADALVLVTEWPEFSRLEPTRLQAQMAGRLVLDARNVLDPDEFERAGLRVVGVGW